MRQEIPQNEKRVRVIAARLGKSCDETSDGLVRSSTSKRKLNVGTVRSELRWFMACRSHSRVHAVHAHTSSLTEAKTTDCLHQ